MLGSVLKARRGGAPARPRRTKLSQAPSNSLYPFSDVQGSGRRRGIRYLPFSRCGDGLRSAATEKPSVCWMVVCYLNNQLMVKRGLGAPLTFASSQPDPAGAEHVMRCRCDREESWAHASVWGALGSWRSDAGRELSTGAALSGFGWKEGRKRSEQRLGLPSFHPVLPDNQVSGFLSSESVQTLDLFGLSTAFSEDSVWTIPPANFIFFIAETKCVELDTPVLKPVRPLQEAVIRNLVFPRGFPTPCPPFQAGCHLTGCPEVNVGTAGLCFPRLHKRIAWRAWGFF